MTTANGLDGETNERSRNIDVLIVGCGLGMCSSSTSIGFATLTVGLVGGLSCAISCAKSGLNVRILEKAKELTTVRALASCCENYR
jgi:hypothetical protein